MLDGFKRRWRGRRRRRRGSTSEGHENGDGDGDGDGEDDSPTPFPEPARNEEQDKIDDALEYLKSHSVPSQTIIDRILAYSQDDGDVAATSPPLSLLDLGCGGGRMALALSPCFSHIYARDPDAQMIELCRTVVAASSAPSTKPSPTATWDIGLGDSRNTNVPPQSIDCIMAANCAHLWNWGASADDDDLYAHFADILRPGGSLIITGARPLAGGYLIGDRQTSDDTHLAHTIKHLAGELFSKAHCPRYKLGFQEMYATVPLPSDTGQWDISTHIYERWTSMNNARTEWTLSEIIGWLRSLAPFRAQYADDDDVAAAAQVDISLNRDLAARVVREACERDGVEFAMGLRVKMVQYECMWAIKKPR